MSVFLQQEIFGTMQRHDLIKYLTYNEGDGDTDDITGVEDLTIILQHLGQFILYFSLVRLWFDWLHASVTAVCQNVKPCRVFALCVLS